MSEELALISVISTSVKTAVTPANLSSAEPPFHLILPSLNLLRNSITVNRLSQTTTTSNNGSAPNKSREPQVDQDNKPHNQATKSNWKVLAKRVNLCNNSVSWESKDSNAIISPVIPERPAETNSHHQSSSPSLQENINATMVHANTIIEATFTVACIV